MTKIFVWRVAWTKTEMPGLLSYFSYFSVLSKQPTNKRNVRRGFGPLPVRPSWTQLVCRDLKDKRLIELLATCRPQGQEREVIRKGSSLLL